MNTTSKKNKVIKVECIDKPAETDVTLSKDIEAGATLTAVSPAVGTEPQKPVHKQVKLRGTLIF